MTDCSMGKIHLGSVAEIQGDTFRFLPCILTLHAVHFATVYGRERVGLIHILSTRHSFWHPIHIGTVPIRDMPLIFFHIADLISTSRKIHALWTMVQIPIKLKRDFGVEFSTKIWITFHHVNIPFHTVLFGLIIRSIMLLKRVIPIVTLY